LDSPFLCRLPQDGVSRARHRFHSAGLCVQADKKDIVGSQEQLFVRQTLDLHDKYLQYVGDCFSNHSLFHKVHPAPHQPHLGFPIK
jgi:hypothetical protein